MIISKINRVLKEFKKQVKYNDNTTDLDINGSKVRLVTTIDGWKIDCIKNFEIKKENKDGSVK